MNYGRFFEFDIESSFLSKGIVVFNYRWLQQNPEPANSRTSPRYPLYVVITPDAISFKLHYYSDTQAPGGSHFHNTIIELQLSPDINVSARLEETLNNCYYAPFPMKNNKPLLDLVKNSFNSADYVMPGFLSMQIFDPEKMEKYEDTNTQDKHLLRKIVLDFMYDLEFTEVFKNTPFYDEMSAKLQKNFLFSALLRKLRYYYFRTEICADEIKIFDAKKNEHEQWNRNAAFFFERYVVAEHEWIAAILDERAVNTFHFSPWFKDAVVEMDQVFNKYAEKDYQEFVTTCADADNYNKSGTVWKTIVTHIKKLGDWICYRGPVKELPLTVEQLYGYIAQAEKTQKPSSPNTEETLAEEKVSSFESAKKLHVADAEKVAQWHVDHYQFKSLFGMWFGYKKGYLKTLGIIILSILAAALGIGALSMLTDLTMALRLLIVLALLSVVFFGIIGPKVRNKHIVFGKGALSFFMPQLLVAIVAAWFTLLLSEDLFKHFVVYDSNIHGFFIFFVALIIGLFVAYQVIQKNPHQYNLNLKKMWRKAWQTGNSLLRPVLAVTLIAFVYAFLVGTIMYDMLGDSMIKNLKEEQQKEVISDRLASNPSPSTVYADNISDMPANSQAVAQQNTTPAITVYPASLQRIVICNHSILVWERDKYRFIFEFSFFAAFIGIFLQIMLQGKSLTKS